MIINTIYLIKLENKLKGQIDAWESEQGSEFLVNGQKFLQYVNEQWQLHQAEKEKEKLERVRMLALCQTDLPIRELTFLFLNVD